MNPICFAGTALLAYDGAWRRWSTREEVLLSAGLLAIPYIAKPYENGMNSQGRFAAVVFPAYIVAGELLTRLPPVAAGAILGISGFFLGVYAALFAAGYPFF